MRHFHLDRIESIEPGVRAVGVRAVALGDDVFTDHFPGNPVLPGVYIIEGLAQAAGVLLWETSKHTRIAIMVSVDRARFIAFARPGDLVRLAVDIVSYDVDAARVRATASVGDREIVVVGLTFSLQEPTRVIPPLFQPFWEHMADVWLGRAPRDGNA